MSEKTTRKQNAQNNSVLSKQICAAAQRIARKCRNKKITPAQRTALHKEITLIAEFYGVNEQQALIIVYVVLAKLLNHPEASVNNLTEWLSVDLFQALELTRDLNSLCMKGLIMKARGGRYDSTEYCLTQRGLNCLMNGIPFPEIVAKIENDFSGVLEKVYMAYSMVYTEAMDMWDLRDCLDEILTEAKSLKEVSFIMEQELTQTDSIILLLGLYDTMIRERDTFDSERIIKNILPQREQFAIKSDILKGISPLLQKDLLTFKTGPFRALTDMCPSESLLAKLYGAEVSKKNNNHLKHGHLDDLSDYKPQQLFYNETEQSVIHEIATVLSAETYPRVLKQLEEHGSYTGITTVLYGEPGTGKTSSVMEIAHRTGRKVFKVEIATMLNAYVGESERNVAELFKEYHDLLKKEPHHPILLLNECDGLLHRRFAGGRSATDNMANTLVTLFLENLENAKGIIFATMNEPNWDPAFDRRFLYKIEMHTPALDTRRQILAHAFPSLPTYCIYTLAHQYKLTGAQIANIKKKYLLKTLAKPNLALHDCIHELCASELGMSISSSGTPIGFRRTA